MSLDSTLAGWVDGAPPTRDDGGLAIVVLKDGVRIDGQDPGGLPVIVSRWNEKLKTTAGSHRLSYDDVSRHIDIAAGENPG